MRRVKAIELENVEEGLQPEEVLQALDTLRCSRWIPAPVNRQLFLGADGSDARGGDKVVMITMRLVPEEEESGEEVLEVTWAQVVVGEEREAWEATCAEEG